MDVYYIVIFPKMHSSASSHAIRNIAPRRQDDRKNGILEFFNLSITLNASGSLAGNFSEAAIMPTNEKDGVAETEKHRTGTVVFSIFHAV